MPQFPTPHSRYRHIFVVMRSPKEEVRGREGQIDEDDVTLTKAYLSERAAREEANRMNQLNGRYWRYSVNVARLVEEPEDDEMRTVESKHENQDSSGAES